MSVSDWYDEFAWAAGELIPLAGTPAEDAAYLDWCRGCWLENKRRQEHKAMVERGQWLAQKEGRAGKPDQDSCEVDAVGEAMERIANRTEVVE